MRTQVFTRAGAVAAALILSLAVPAGVATAGTAPAADGGAVGVGIQAQPVILTTTAVPGHSYLFPTVYVINEGTTTVTVGLGVQERSEPDGTPPPAAWITFPQPTVTLASKQEAHLPVSLQVPVGAANGTYGTYLVARVQTSGTTAGTGAALGAAAATKLTFVISDHPPSSAAFLPWWAYLSGAGLLILLLLAWLARRSGLRLRLTRI